MHSYLLDLYHAVLVLNILRLREFKTLGVKNFFFSFMGHSQTSDTSVHRVQDPVQVYAKTEFNI